MEKQYLMGIDIGTSRSKGTLVNAGGQIIASHTLDHITKELQPGYFEHDADLVWYGDLCRISRALLEKSGAKPEQVASVGVSGLGPCVLPVGKDGTPLRDAILYGIDTRSVGEITELNSLLGEDAILEQCGNLLSTQAAGTKILWIRHNEPDVYDRTWKFMTSSTYLVYKLTGQVVIDHYTACAGFTPLYNYSRQCWDCGFAPGITEEERLPRLAWSSEVAGYVTSRASADTGLAEGTPVITGTCDASAEAVSVGAVETGKVMLMFGTTVFIVAVTSRPVKDARVWSAPYLFPGTYSVLGGMGAAGSLTNWFIDEFARDLPEEAKRTGRSPYDLLMEKAELVPAGCDGLIMLPYFNGERTPLNDPFARGSYFGLTLGHTRAHLYRAVLESVGNGIRDNLEVMSSRFQMPHRLFAVGGGVKSPLWMQIVSDITGIPVQVNDVSVGASYGDAFLAGLGIGMFQKPGDVADWLREKEVFLPNPANKEVYDRQFAIYRELYESTREMTHRLSGR